MHVRTPAVKYKHEDLSQGKRSFPQSIGFACRDHHVDVDGCHIGHLEGGRLVVPGWVVN